MKKYILVIVLALFLCGGVFASSILTIAQQEILTAIEGGASCSEAIEDTLNVIYDALSHVPKFGGTIWFVSEGGSDDSSGRDPHQAFLTIGNALDSTVSGDAVSVMAGTYTGVGLVLGEAGVKDNLEMWCEIGTIISPASGIALTIAGNYCKLIGEVSIFPTGAAGLLVSGANCVISEVKSLAAGVGTDCYHITGAGVVMTRCVGGFPTATYAGFNISGAQGRFYECSVVGNTTSYGYHIQGGVDTGVISNATSTGHASGGYYIDANSTDWTILDCSSGGGDGKWVDVDHANIWSGFTYPETKYKSITLDNSHAYNLFEITGGVEIIEISGTVTTTLEGANTDVSFQLYGSTGPNTDIITKATDADMGTAAVGSIVIKTEDPGKKVTFLSAGVPSVDKGTDPKKKKATLVAALTGTTHIRWVCAGNNDTSGAIDFHVEWRPMNDDGFLEPYTP